MTKVEAPMTIIDRLAQLAEKATPGPWGWFGNANSNSLYLATVNRGRRFIMQFARWGMRGAQPRFQVDGRMVDAADLLEFEVCHAIGAEAAKKDRDCYRLDVSGIAHADAAHIAACSPEVILALCRVARAAEAVSDEYGSDIEKSHIDGMDALDDALSALNSMEDGKS